MALPMRVAPRYGPVRIASPLTSPTVPFAGTTGVTVGTKAVAVGTKPIGVAVTTAVPDPVHCKTYMAVARLGSPDIGSVSRACRRPAALGIHRTVIACCPFAFSEYGNG